MNEPEGNHYETLGINPNADLPQIKKAYRAMSLLWHPDKHNKDDNEKATNMFKRVNIAKDVLSGASSRSLYDSEQRFKDRHFRTKQYLDYNDASSGLMPPVQQAPVSKAPPSGLSGRGCVEERKRESSADVGPERGSPQAAAVGSDTATQPESSAEPSAADVSRGSPQAATVTSAATVNPDPSSMLPKPVSPRVDVSMTKPVARTKKAASPAALAKATIRPVQAKASPWDDMVRESEGQPPIERGSPQAAAVSVEASPQAGSTDQTSREAPRQARLDDADVIGSFTAKDGRYTGYPSMQLAEEFAGKTYKELYNAVSSYDPVPDAKDYNFDLFKTGDPVSKQWADSLTEMRSGYLRTWF